eukprot:TRINITY_DN27829_c0_g1_i1.p1 TRINITY_DN27829_c0_g1~~TRINITY_DN27829_c0_g1_i1.p1  ORF type:complete len:169 (-),score=17.49 TRINITY_DN27829_c0_g1_i1:488-994(-)
MSNQEVEKQDVTANDSTVVHQSVASAEPPEAGVLPIPSFSHASDPGSQDDLKPDTWRDVFRSSGQSFIDARLETRGGRLALEACMHPCDGPGPVREPIPSLGAVLHAHSSCLPCRYFRQSTGCKDEISCAFCHHEHKELSRGQVQRQFRENARTYRSRFDSFWMRLSV